MDPVKEDMQVVGVRIEDTENKVKWNTDSLRRPLKRDNLNRKEEAKNGIKTVFIPHWRHSLAIAAKKIKK